jgi:DNA-binding NtrC family response regulator
MSHYVFPATSEAAPPFGVKVADVERELVLRTLAACNGNRTHAARALGISVRTLRNRIRLYSAHGIDVPAPQASTPAN